MVKVVSLALAALSFSSSVLAAPSGWDQWSGSKTNYYPVVDKWLEKHQPGKYQPCNEKNIRVRKDFDSMPPEERKAYTDAINCLRSQPSQLDPKEYPGAINRFFDYATVHVNKTRVVHLDGFFLVWHRLYNHIFENDLRDTCGYTGSYPYWNWPATADNLRGSPIFNGDEYSMSGDGLFTNNNPIVLSPSLSVPHGTGGGCVTQGPFAGMNTTMLPVSNQFLLNGTAPPHSIYNKVEKCLTRDLNTFAAQTWTNYTAVQTAVEAEDIHTFEQLVNGVIGGGSLGIHSGAHFIMGNPASNIFVSAQDPIWYPLHTMLDRVYTSWQARHPDIMNTLTGTETAQNLPPSANVTLDTVVPDAGYFSNGQQYTIGELISTTSGPFCYKYDINI
ncbi:hypothetical protein PMZ80_010507 [Knufia obscura]|uniref:Tyrosinase copper-binding domain-containing protein n=2 Tax=Knufia TaxID=430999 RepID=A0AAN8F2Z4_9EURO|nr:hypothetical protein PMZ80_010507 [Knufia obscura]KAK5950141.1 hypothetical protein OHC33_008856 [Knufia fluminis]